MNAHLKFLPLLARGGGPAPRALEKIVPPLLARGGGPAPRALEKIVPPPACKGRGTGASRVGKNSSSPCLQGEGDRRQPVEGFLRGRAKWFRKGSDLAENPSNLASRSPSLGKVGSFPVINFQCPDLCIRVWLARGGGPASAGGGFLDWRDEDLAFLIAPLGKPPHRLATVPPSFGKGGES